MSILRAIECAVLFLVLPLALALLPFRISPIPVLIAATVLVMILLLRDPSFNRFALTTLPDLRRNLVSMLLIIPIAAALLAGLLYWLQPAAMFSFPRQQPNLWILVMCMYPIVSVVPQTIIYRVFFMHRYEPLFGKGWTMVFVATAAFALCHIIFKHPLPILLTSVGGLLFAWRYWSTGSAPLSALEHAIYGDLAFTIGYGWYLYHGSMRTMQ